MLTFCLEKLPKNKIESITVTMKISSKANMLKGLKMKDRELFSSNFETFSDDLKTSLSNEEFNRAVVAATKTAPSTIVLNFNLNGLNIFGRSVGFFRLNINNCLNSISFQLP